MRVAGGSVVPALPGHPTARRRPELRVLGSDAADRARRFRRWRYRWLPGFALVSRDDLLQQRLAQMQAHDANATALDAWLDASCFVSRPEQSPVTDSDPSTVAGSVVWENTSSVPGWIVPMPVGYGALSQIYEPGQVLRTRDAHTPTRFVESVYSLGQWVSPHRVQDARDLLWYSRYHADTNLYRCHNDFRPPSDVPSAPETL
jgi:CRISPR-associated protein Csy2